MGIIRFLHNNKNDRIGNKTTTTGAKVALWVVAWSILQPGDYLQLRQLLTHLMINNVAVKDVTLSMCFRYIGFYCISLYWICNFDDKQQCVLRRPGPWSGQMKDKSFLYQSQRVSLVISISNFNYFLSWAGWSIAVVSLPATRTPSLFWGNCLIKLLVKIRPAVRITPTKVRPEGERDHEFIVWWRDSGLVTAVGRIPLLVFWGPFRSCLLLPPA